MCDRKVTCSSTGSLHPARAACSYQTGLACLSLACRHGLNSVVRPIEPREGVSRIPTSTRSSSTTPTAARAQSVLMGPSLPPETAQESSMSCAVSPTYVSRNSHPHLSRARPGCSRQTVTVRREKSQLRGSKTLSQPTRDVNRRDRYCPFLVLCVAPANIMERENR